MWRGRLVDGWAEIWCGALADKNNTRRFPQHSMWLANVLNSVKLARSALPRPDDLAFGFHRGLILRIGQCDVDIVTRGKTLGAGKAEPCLGNIARLGNIHDSPCVAHAQLHRDLQAARPARRPHTVRSSLAGTHQN